MSRRYISIAESAEYLKTSDRTVRRLIADGELTGYFIGRGHRMLRVDLDEIDGKLMRPIGFHWNDASAKPRERERPHVPDRSAAVKP
jgi:excisionase family DNA binding protein